MKVLALFTTSLIWLSIPLAIAGVASDQIEAKSILDVDLETVEQIRKNMNGFVSEFENLPASNHKKQLVSKHSVYGLPVHNPVSDGEETSKLNPALNDQAFSRFLN
jgi:hypothetical protein